MKTYMKTLLALAVLFTSAALKPAFAQQNSGLVQKPLVAVVAFDTRGYPLNQMQMIQHLNNELVRIGYYEVLDKYDIEYIARKDTLVLEDCFSKPCMLEVGRKLGVAKMLTGSITQMGEKIVVSLRLLDVTSGTFEKAHVREFLQIKGNEFMMVRVTLNEMYGLPNDADLVNKLTLKSEYESSVNNPYKLKLRADGPRMGMVMYTGLNAEIMKAPTGKGGFDGQPYMFQFGYQFERQYLNEGNFQALFEFIPMLTGLDQGRAIPSFTFLNGLRNNKNGWEFAFGPSVSFARVAKGFYDSADNWHLSSELQDYTATPKPDLVSRLDSRGEVNMSASFVFAAGKTFKSGRLNLPVNFFFIPSNNGARLGLSIGWNGKDRYSIDN